MIDSFDIRNGFASLSPSGPHPLRGAGCLLSLCSPAGCLRQAISAALRFAALGSAFGIRPVHPDLRADYVLANPPFNDSDWFRKDDVGCAVALN